MNEIIKRVETETANSNPAQEFMANTKGKRIVTITDELGVTLTMEVVSYVELNTEMINDYSWLGRDRMIYKPIRKEPTWMCSFECIKPVLTYPKGVQPINGTNS